MTFQSGKYGYHFLLLPVRSPHTFLRENKPLHRNIIRPGSGFFPAVCFRERCISRLFGLPEQGFLRCRCLSASRADRVDSEHRADDCHPRSSLWANRASSPSQALVHQALVAVLKISLPSLNFAVPNGRVSSANFAPSQLIAFPDR